MLHQTSKLGIPVHVAVAFMVGDLVFHGMASVVTDGSGSSYSWLVCSGVSSVIAVRARVPCLFVLIIISGVMVL